MQTLVDCGGELVPDSICHIEPVQVGMLQLRSCDITLHYNIVTNVFKKNTSITLQELNAIEKMKTGCDVADLIS